MVRKYYKYVYSNNDLRMSSGNTLLGGDSLAITNYGVCYQTNYPWHVFDGKSNTAWISTIGIPTYLIWSFPHPTYLGAFGDSTTNIVIRVVNYTGNFPRAGTLDYSDDCVNWTKHADWSSNGGSGAYFDIDTTNIGYHKYYRLYVSSSSASTNVSIAQIYNDGNRMRAVQESTSSDYDFYEDVPEYKSTLSNNNYKVALTNERVYYKYTKTSFTTPILTANNNLGGRSFAVAASSQYSATYAPWHAFDGSYASNNGWVTANGVKSGWITFYNPQKLYITKLGFQNRNATSAATIGSPESGTVYGSNDNVNWVVLKEFTNSEHAANAGIIMTLDSNLGDYYYYRLECETLSTNNYLALGEVYIDEAVIRTPQISTSSDYDFYEDVDKYRLIEV